MDCIEGSSDVSGRASVGAINLSSRPSSVPTTATTTAAAALTTSTNCNNVDGEMQDESVSYKYWICVLNVWTMFLNEVFVL